MSDVFTHLFSPDDDESRLYGVAIGIVTNNKDPDGLGRVKVKLPWMAADLESDWARVVTPMAGAQRGMYFIPEVDDEVLVAFEHGDFDHPFVVGFLWNGVDKPPDTDNKHRVIVTPGGHELRFEDDDGAKQVILKTSGGHKITLNDKSGSTTVTVKTNGGHTLELNDTQQSVTAQTAGGGQTLTLSDGTQSAELQGGGRSLKLIGGLVKIS